MPYKRSLSSRKQKRWQISATVGKSVPFIGGSSFRAGSGHQKRSLDTHIKNVVRSQVLEPKVFHLDDTYSPTLLHNTIYTYNIMKDITIGTNDNQREGDYVHFKKAHYQCQFFGATAGSSDRLHLRYMVVKSKIADTTSGIVSSHLGATDIFYATADNLLLAHWSPRECTVILDNTITTSPAYANQKISKQFVIDLDLPKFVYEEASLVGKFYNYYLVFIPYQDRASAGVTAVGDLVINGLTGFTDGK
uniref:hypothetical protein n=1 Tax=Yoonia sp. TaxID=2212373 RepID=UPI0040479B53